MSSVDERPTGKAYWRSLDDLADKPEFRALVQREFPSFAEEMLAPSRRSFLKLMGASVALAGATACRRWPEELIVPFAHRPEGYVPGVPVQYATSMEVAGAVLGLLVTSYDGRPVKVEGNPGHPASLGGTDAFAQAAILQMYDPDRAARVTELTSGPSESGPGTNSSPTLGRSCGPIAPRAGGDSASSPRGPRRRPCSRSRPDSSRRSRVPPGTNGSR